MFGMPPWMQQMQGQGMGPGAAPMTPGAGMPPSNAPMSMQPQQMPQMGMRPPMPMPPMGGGGGGQQPINPAQMGMLSQMLAGKTGAPPPGAGPMVPPGMPPAPGNPNAPMGAGSQESGAGMQGQMGFLARLLPQLFGGGM